MTLPTLANTPRPRAAGFGVAIDDSLFRLAAAPNRQMQFETVPPEPPPMDTRENAEEMPDTHGRTFARDDFTGGEGLDYAHTRDERVNRNRRYFDSRNIDFVATDAGETRAITLLHTTAAVDTPTPALPRFGHDGTSLWYPSGTTLRKSANPTAATPAWADASPHAGEAAVTVNDVVALGTTVYAALGANGVHRTTGGAWSHWSDIAATRVWAAQSRVLAAAGQSLYEAAAGAVPTPLYTLPAGETWNDVVDAGAAILAAASDGTIYAFAPDTVTGALRLYAQTPIEGEVPTALGYAQDIVFYGTSQPSGTGAIGRLWRATLSEGYVLTGAQVLREWKSTTLDRAPRRITASRDSVYTAVVEDAGETHAWRYDLDDAALHRSYIFGASGVAYGLLLLGGKMFAGIAGAAVRRQTSIYATEGWLIGPLGDFFTSAIKSWVGARLDTATVGAGQRVELHYAIEPSDILDDEAAGWRLVKSVTSGRDESETAIVGIASRWIAGQVRLQAAAGGVSAPSVSSFAFRAVMGGTDTPTRVLVFPVNVSDQVRLPGRRPITVPGLGQQMWAALKAKESKAVTLQTFNPPLTMRGQIEQVTTPVGAQPRQGSATAFSMVRFRGSEAPEPQVSGSAGGVGLLGVLEMGA